MKKKKRCSSQVPIYLTPLANDGACFPPIPGKIYQMGQQRKYVLSPNACAQLFLMCRNSLEDAIRFPSHSSLRSINCTEMFMGKACLAMIANGRRWRNHRGWFRNKATGGGRRLSNLSPAPLQPSWTHDGRHPEGSPRGSFCCWRYYGQRTPHGGALVLTPEGEREGSQGERSSGGRHLRRWSLRATPRFPQPRRPRRYFRGNPVGRTAPRGRRSG